MSGIFLITVAAVFCIALAITGFGAGKTEDTVSLRRWSKAAVAILFLLGCGTVLLRKPIAYVVLKMKYPRLANIMPSEAFIIPVDFTVLITVLAVLSGIVVFLCCLACRKNSSSWKIALPWAAVTLLWCNFVAFSPLYYGLLCWVGMFCGIQENSQNNHSLFITMMCLLIINIIALVIWTVWSWRRKEASWKSIPVFSGIMLIFSLVLWLSGYGAGVWAEKRLSARAAALGITPYKVLTPLPSDQYAEAVSRSTRELYRNHPDFSPPFSGVYSWSEKENAVSPKKREYTLKVFDSPDVINHLKVLERSASRLSGYDVFYIDTMNHFRSLIRYVLDRAALFSLTGQKDKAMQEFMKYPEYEKMIPYDTPVRIAELVRNATRKMWIECLVKYGPEEKRFLPYYRKLLKWSEMWRVHLPSEAGFYINPDITADKLNSSIGSFFRSPAVKIIKYRKFCHAADRIPLLKELEKQEIFSGIDHDVSMARRQRTNIVYGRTALALKTFKVENGRYPQNLDELYPRYLDKKYIDMCKIRDIIASQ